MVTSNPFIRALAAASTPMNPPPITPRWPLPVSSRSRTACESSIVRIIDAVPSFRGVAPVASASRPYSICTPSASVTVCAETSIADTSVSSLTSTSCSTHHSAGCMKVSYIGVSPRRKSLVSGGR